MKKVYGDFKSLIHCLCNFRALRSKDYIRKSGLLRIEPGADRWDARMLPLCYVAP